MVVLQRGTRGLGCCILDPALCLCLHDALHGLANTALPSVRVKALKTLANFQRCARQWPAGRKASAAQQSSIRLLAPLKGSRHAVRWAVGTRYSITLKLPLLLDGQDVVGLTGGQQQRLPAWAPCAHPAAAQGSAPAWVRTTQCPSGCSLGPGQAGGCPGGQPGHAPLLLRASSAPVAERLQLLLRLQESTATHLARDLPEPVQRRPTCLLGSNVPAAVTSA